MMGMIPDLSQMRIGSPCGAGAGGGGGGGGGEAGGGKSVTPKCGFTWDRLEKAGGMTYELPKGMKIDKSKAGLFYFQ